jgi:hypothetical protein
MMIDEPLARTLSDAGCFPYSFCQTAPALRRRLDACAVKMYAEFVGGGAAVALFSPIRKSAPQ